MAAGGVIRWTEYSCPNCRKKYTDYEIAKAHHSKRCPACMVPILVDAKIYLKNTKDAVTASYFGMAVGGGIWFGCGYWILQRLDVGSFSTWPLAAKLSFLVLGLVTGYGVGTYFQNQQVDTFLAGAKRDIDEGL